MKKLTDMDMALSGGGDADEMNNLILNAMELKRGEVPCEHPAGCTAPATNTVRRSHENVIDSYHYYCAEHRPTQ